MPGGNQRGRRLWALIAVLAITFAIVGSSTVAGAAQLSGRLVAAHLEQNNDQLDAYAFSLNGVRLVPATSATGDQMAQLNGATVTVTGTMSGGSLVVTGVAVAYSAALSTPPISSTSAPRKVAVIIAQYADSVPASAATARSIVFNGPDSLDSYLREVFARSTRVIGGRADVNNGDVFGPVVLSRPTNANRCSVDTVLDEVGVALMFAGHYFGYESSYYDNAMVFLPDQPCSLRGLGYTPGNLFATRDPSLAVVAHEFGHNLGLGHAGGRKCWNSAGKRVSLAGSSGRCTTYSYADPFDEMGNRQLAGQGNPNTTRCTRCSWARCPRTRASPRPRARLSTRSVSRRSRSASHSWWRFRGDASPTARSSRSWSTIERRTGTSMPGRRPIPLSTASPCAFTFRGYCKRTNPTPWLSTQLRVPGRVWTTSSTRRSPPGSRCTIPSAA